ncbi:MAG: PH domain-containing protein [Patescibacteria group bacterium]
MFNLEDVLQMKDEERVKSITRRHILTLLPPLFLSVLLIVAPFFLLFPLFAWGVFGVILFFVSVLIGIIIAVRALLMWDSDVLIVTNFRIIDVDQKGLLARTVSEASLSSVQDVSWSRQGLIQTIFKIGTVTVQTAGATTTITAGRIPHAEEIYALINDLRHVPEKKQGDGESRDSKLNSIMALLETYSLEELKRIEIVLKARERQSAADAFLKQDEHGDSEESES